jgi:hypothetical protein
MAGIQADRGDKSHRVVSGEPTVVGLRVFTNNLDRGVIVKVSERMDEECGWYCPAWHTVELDTDYKGNPIEPKRRTSMNCDRLTTTFEGRKA